MTKPTVVEEVPMSLIEVKEEIEKIKKRDKEINFRVTKTEDYLNSFVKNSYKEHKELFEKLNTLNIPRLKETQICKIIDLMPNTPELVKLLFQGSTITISEDNAKKIAKAVEEYKKE
jgi:DNA-directed RNA polymerase subunit F